MQFTLRQLLDDPSHADRLSDSGIVKLKTDLEHFINHEYVLTQRIQTCQTALQFDCYSDTEIINIQDEIGQHQTTIMQLHTLYDHVCNMNHEYNVLPMACLS
jgi:hypothetical protein